MEIEQIIEAVLDEATKRSASSGYSGEMNDGGANELRMQVRFYRHGQRGSIPIEWSFARKVLDPEYQTYLNLKKKFEGV
jgi:hypothetical protein